MVFRPAWCREGDPDLKQKDKEGSLEGTEVLSSQISSRETKMLNTRVVFSQ